MTCFARITVAVLLLALSLPVASYAREPFTLDAVRAKVQRDYRGIQHLSGEVLAKKLKGGGVLLIDVRERDEFAVSRIPGAERVDPDVRSAAFLNGFKDKARGKTVVFYCSVGVRSSRLAEHVQAALTSAGARAVTNLDGGIFGWHNQQRALVNAQGATGFVHPFDSHWGKLVERREMIRTVP